jgi:hypothetical protein
MKMPILLSSYHEGNGRESNEVQSGVYFGSTDERREQQRRTANANDNGNDDRVLDICEETRSNRSKTHGNDELYEVAPRHSVEVNRQRDKISTSVDRAKSMNDYGHRSSPPRSVDSLSIDGIET